MNKKLGIVLVFALLVGAVFLSACQQDAVGRKIGGDIGVREAEDLQKTISCSGSVTCTANDGRGTVTVNCVPKVSGRSWGCGVECSEGYTASGTCSAPEWSPD